MSSEWGGEYLPLSLTGCRTSASTRRDCRIVAKLERMSVSQPKTRLEMLCKLIVMIASLYSIAGGGSVALPESIAEVQDRKILEP